MRNLIVLIMLLVADSSYGQGKSQNPDDMLGRVLGAGIFFGALALWNKYKGKASIIALLMLCGGNIYSQGLHVKGLTISKPLGYVEPTPINSLTEEDLENMKEVYKDALSEQSYLNELNQTYRELARERREEAKQERQRTLDYATAKTAELIAEKEAEQQAIEDKRANRTDDEIFGISPQERITINKREADLMKQIDNDILVENWTKSLVIIVCICGFVYAVSRKS
jgi:hypothetical protein